MLPYVNIMYMNKYAVSIHIRAVSTHECRETIGYRLPRDRMRTVTRTKDLASYPVH